MSGRPSTISKKLEQTNPQFFSLYCIVAAFGTYFCMYAFRKPISAGTFEEFKLGSLDYKPVLIAAQVIGYTLSKFIGIKFVAEVAAARRAVGIVVLIAIAEVALLLFAITPPPYNLFMLFLNGLPLGMVFGLVLGFLEGRKVTEALVAGLCASFIVSSGVVKSVGRVLIDQFGVSEFWMPFVTGLLFVGPLLVFVWMLNQIPTPSKDDVVHRSKRTPMTRAQRWDLLWRHFFGLSAIVMIYILLTIMRSIRDDFAVEIWRDMGEGGKPAIFTQSEMLVAIGVVVINGLAIRIQSNRLAFLGAIGLVGVGFVVALGSIAGHTLAWLSPFAFMVLVGLGTYIPYVAFHTTVFERFIAAFREPGNIGYLMYLADATGYLTYVAILLVRDFGNFKVDMLALFVHSSSLIAVVSLVLTIVLVVYYSHRLPKEH